MVQFGLQPQQLRPLRRSRHDAHRVHPGAENPYLLPQELQLGVVSGLQPPHGNQYPGVEQGLHGHSYQIRGSSQAPPAPMFLNTPNRRLAVIGGGERPSLC